MSFVRWLLRALGEAEDRKPFRTRRVALAKDLQRSVGYSVGLVLAALQPPSYTGRWVLAILCAVAAVVAVAGVRRGGHRLQAQLMFADAIIAPTVVLLATRSVTLAHATAFGIAALAMILLRIDGRVIVIATTIGVALALWGSQMVATTDRSRLATGTYVVLLVWFVMVLAALSIQWWQTRRSLVTREAELASLLGAAPVTLVTIDHTGAIASLAGRALDERWELESPLLRLLPAPLAAAAAGALAGRTTTLDVVVGTRLLQMTCTPNPTGATLTGFDITDRENTRRELEQLIATKDRFVASISHELRTPLTAVLGFANELRLSPDLSDMDGEYVEFIADQGAEMAAIIEDLLVAARADLGLVTVLPARVDLATEVEAVVDGLQGRSRRSIAIEAEPTAAVADPVRLRQIVRNLITNADRYGGDRVEVAVGTDDEGPFVDVRDSGPPLSDEQQHRMFLPYVSSGRGESQPSAIGLGLAVSRTLTEMMDGSLAYLHDGDWGIFRLRLPTEGVEAPRRPLASSAG